MAKRPSNKPPRRSGDDTRWTREQSDASADAEAWRDVIKQVVPSGGRAGYMGGIPLPPSLDRDQEGDASRVRFVQGRGHLPILQSWETANSAVSQASPGTPTYREVTSGSSSHLPFTSNVSMP